MKEVYEKKARKVATKVGNILRCHGLKRMGADIDCIGARIYSFDPENDIAGHGFSGDNLEIFYHFRWIGDRAYLREPEVSSHVWGEVCKGGSDFEIDINAPFSKFYDTLAKAAAATKDVEKYLAGVAQRRRTKTGYSWRLDWLKIY